VGRTPDRTPGPSLEEETQYEHRTVDPSVDGAVGYRGDNGEFVMKDALGAFNPRSVGTDDKKVKVSLNDTVADYLFAKLVAAGAIGIAELNDGGNEQVEFRVGIRNDNKVLLSHSPTTPSGTSGSSWSEIGALYWAGSSIVGSTSDYIATWKGWVEPGSADYEVRLIRSSTGAVLGSTLIAGGGIQQAMSISVDLSLMPLADDGIIIHHRSVGGGSGGRTYAGQLVTGFAP
jgi:hypothetical protein